VPWHIPVEFEHRESKSCQNWLKILRKINVVDRYPNNRQW
jgi:hypothetical protein